jgi:HJR/Mrr/RecB family endonuclease
VKGTRRHPPAARSLITFVPALARCVSLLAGALLSECLARAVAPGPPLHGAFPDAALVLAAASGAAVLGLPAAARRDKRRAAGVAEVDEMAGAAFEARLAALFAAMGWAVEATGRRGDFGADLVVEGGGERVVVQAKRYGRPVGIEAVQQAIGATRHYDADGAMVVTTAVCTPAARSLAASNGVRLVERDELFSLLAAHPLRRAAPPRRVVATGAALLVRQLLDGVVLVAYALGLVVRVLWWVLRAPSRALR